MFTSLACLDSWDTYIKHLASFFLSCVFQQQKGLPRWHSGKESTYQCRRRGFEPWVRKIPWRRKWQPTPVFLSGKFHGQKSLAGYSQWSRKELDTTEHAFKPSQQKAKGIIIFRTKEDIFVSFAVSSRTWGRREYLSSFYFPFYINYYF